MIFYRFKTFTTSYYFPSLTRGEEFMYGLYSPYGSRLSRMYWWTFRKSRAVRMLSAVGEEHLPFPYELIRKADGTASKMAFNMGSPGVEQKISILGHDEQAAVRFFAKYAEKPVARELTRHEAQVYGLLADTGLTPRLYALSGHAEGVYMKAEYVAGHRPESRLLTADVTDQAIQISQRRMGSRASTDDGLQVALSHGDFCPWNMLVSAGRYRLIDWEMAADRPLGYDVFTFVCQVGALFEPSTPLLQHIACNRDCIDRYFSAFGVADHRPYLQAFATEKTGYERSKGNVRLSGAYRQLQEVLS